jgi:hypothetical protein
MNRLVNLAENMGKMGDFGPSGIVLLGYENDPDLTSREDEKRFSSVVCTISPTQWLEPARMKWRTDTQLLPFRPAPSAFSCHASR